MSFKDYIQLNDVKGVTGNATMLFYKILDLVMHIWW